MNETAASRDAVTRGGRPPAAVQIWKIGLDQEPATRNRLASALSAEESARIRSLRFATHRDRFTVAHGALRAILASRLGRAPADLEFTLDPGGKPRLLRRAGEIDLRFSLSHSDGLALLAVTTGREIGVDVERVDERTEVMKLAERYFTPQEVGALRALSPAARRDEFFRCWTLKEAYLKALGVGLRRRLDSFAVAAAAPGPARLLWSAEGDAANWTLRTLAPAERYVAALVTEGEAGEPDTREWLADRPRPRDANSAAGSRLLQ